MEQLLSKIKEETSLPAKEAVETIIEFLDNRISYYEKVLEITISQEDRIEVYKAMRPDTLDEKKWERAVIQRVYQQIIIEGTDSDLKGLVEAIRMPSSFENRNDSIIIFLDECIRKVEECAGISIDVITKASLHCDLISKLQETLPIYDDFLKVLNEFEENISAYDETLKEECIKIYRQFQNEILFLQSEAVMQTMRTGMAFNPPRTNEAIDKLIAELQLLKT